MAVFFVDFFCKVIKVTKMVFRKAIMTTRGYFFNIQSLVSKNKPDDLW